MKKTAFTPPPPPFLNKAFLTKLLSLLMIISFSISSCKKKDPSPAGYVYLDDVYIAGSYTANGISYPAYWKNGIKVDLKSLDGATLKAGNVNAIMVSGTTVYAVGYLSEKPGQVILWKNGQASQVTQNNENDASGYAITVSGTDVYIAGEQNGTNNHNVPVYWKISGNALPKVKALAMEAVYSAQGYGIGILNNTIYVTGTVRNFNGFKAILWTDDGTNNPAIPSELNNSSVESYNTDGSYIIISGSDIYISGREQGFIKYWINNKNTSVTLSATASETNFAGGIAVDASKKVYIAGNDASGAHSKVLYWYNGSPTILTVLSTTVDEYAAGIAVAGNNVYVTGYSGTDLSNYRSILWINGKKVPGFDGSQYIYASSLFVVKK